MLTVRRCLMSRCLMSLAAGAAAAATITSSATSPAALAAPMAAGEVAAPSDSISNSQQWVLDMLHVSQAWRVTKGAGVTVAVIDSGVDPDVSDLSGQVTSGGDFTGLAPQGPDPHWGEHGTWMASIIAGHRHDDGTSGIMGVAPAAKILSIRVIPDKDDLGYHTYEAEHEQAIQDSLAAGIMEAVHSHVQVISMSIGYSSPSTVVRHALEVAYSSGIVLVASAGNSGHDDATSRSARDTPAPVSFPADYPGVISVGAVDRTYRAAGFSSDNLSVQVAAPGVNVPAQGRGSLYWTVDGTSPACALVAGVAALIKSRYRTLSPALVLEALTITATRHGKSRYNVSTGFGIVNAAAALRKAGQLSKMPPGHSQVALSATFGGGPAGIPAAPVTPRGAGELVVFTVLTIVSLALIAAAIGWLAMTRRPRTGSHAS